MKTPFDGAIRVRRREIDAMRVAISVEVDRLVEIDGAETDAAARMRHERSVAADDGLLSSHAYMMRMAAERTRLARDRAVVDAKLIQLRAGATAAYGVSRAIEAAADGFRAEATQAAAAVEQGALDDLSAASFVRGLLAAPRPGSR
jgi:hypothetical protein